MHQRFDECSVQLQRAWQRVFVSAIMLMALPMAFDDQFEKPGAANNQTLATVPAVLSQPIPNYFEAQIVPAQITPILRDNPHPGLAVVAEKRPITRSDLPNLAFASVLNTSLKNQPYKVLGTNPSLLDTDWVNIARSTNDWAELTANLNDSEVTTANKLIALFQPEIKPEPKKWVIVLDAGHGGSDPGSKAANGLIEKELTLDIAKRAEAFLSELDNVEVVLTRDKDKGMSRWSRVNKVKQSNADVVVSLHFNHLPQTNINLVETYYAGQRNILESQAKQLEEQGKQPVMKMAAAKQYGFTKKSKRLAGIMQSRVYNEVRLDNEQAENAGVKQDTLFILTRSFTPGVLIELSCISNEIEAERLTDETYRTRLAASLADGIRDYLSKPMLKARLETRDSHRAFFCPFKRF